MNIPAENYPRLNPSILPVAESSNLNSNASRAMVAGYRLLPSDDWLSNGNIILSTDQKLLEVMVLDSTGSENPISLDEKELNLIGRMKLSYDATLRTVTHRYRYSREGRILSLDGKTFKDHLSDFLGGR